MASTMIITSGEGISDANAADLVYIGKELTELYAVYSWKGRPYI